MKKVLLSLVAAGLSIASYAQSIVHGVSPASIAQNFEYTYGDDATWGPNNFNTTLTIAPAIFVEDGTPGNDANGNPISHQGCNNLTNAAALSGKIALVNRGECNFGLKALKAQQAGALGVVIVNNAPGGPIGMNGGTEGVNVTIPVVMIGKEDGDLLRAALVDGPIELMLGLKIGFFDYDLAIKKSAILTPRNMVHNPLLSPAQDENVGMWIFNHGAEDLSNVIAKVQVKDGSNAVVWEEVSNALSIDAGDSVLVETGGLNAIGSFSAELANGNYKLVYVVENEDEEFASDNSIEMDYSVSSTSWSIVNHLTTPSIYDANNGVRPLDQVATEQLFCNQYRHANASAIAVTGFHSGFSTTASSLNGKVVAGYIFSWDNVFADMDDPALAIDQLNQVGFGEYFFATDATSGDANIVFEEPVALLDNQRYLVCVSSLDTSLYFAYSTARDLTMNIATAREAYSPQLTSQWYLLGFGEDYTMVVGLDVIPVESIAVSQTEMLEGKAFPNPVNDLVRLQIAKDGAATVTVTDLAGRTVSTQDLSFASNQAIVDMTTATSGMYIINVVYNDGARAKFNVVKK